MNSRHHPPSPAIRDIARGLKCDIDTALSIIPDVGDRHEVLRSLRDLTAIDPKLLYTVLHMSESTRQTMEHVLERASSECDRVVIAEDRDATAAHYPDTADLLKLVECSIADIERQIIAQATESGVVNEMKRRLAARERYRVDTMQALHGRLIAAHRKVESLIVEKYDPIVRITHIVDRDPTGRRVTIAWQASPVPIAIGDSVILVASQKFIVRYGAAIFRPTPNDDEWYKSSHTDTAIGRYKRCPILATMQVPAWKTGTTLTPDYKNTDVIERELRHLVHKHGVSGPRVRASTTTQ